MNIYLVLEVSWIENHWKIKTVVDVFTAKEDAQRYIDEIKKALPSISDVTWEYIDGYEIEERKVN